MRVTDRSRIETLMIANQRASENLSKTSAIAASNQEVTMPSDDPAKYAEKVRRDYDQAMLDTRSSTAQDAQGELEIASNALSSGVDIMQTAEDTAIQGANATSDPLTRKTLATNVLAMRSELMSIANTKYNDRYIFAGTKSDTIPFDANGNFQGNDQQINVPVMDGVNLPANASGAQAFTSAGGRDIFGDLQALADALNNNDDAGIQTALTNIKSGHDQVVKAQVQSGYSARRFSDASDVLSSTKAVVATQESNDIDGDQATQITNMQMAQVAYQRSIAVTKAILGMSTGNS